MKKTWLIITANIITFFLLFLIMLQNLISVHSQYHNNRICRKGNHGNQLNVLQQIAAQKNMQYHRASTPTTSTISTRFLFILILIIKQALHHKRLHCKPCFIVTEICYRSQHEALCYTLIKFKSRSNTSRNRVGLLSSFHQFGTHN